MKRIFSTLFLSVCLLKIYAQTADLTVKIARAEFQAKQIIPPSPNAAELGKYGNVPVSLFTGTPNISIPLYELKGVLLSLPITMSYNASGFKPEDAAPWVGSGWSLNAGGVITRSVMGNPDMSGNYFNATTVPGPLSPPEQIKVFPFYNWIGAVQRLELEPQPDIYYYNFAGFSGKFLLKPNQTVVKKKKDMLQISSGILNQSGSQFTVKDENGNLYTFADVEVTRSQPNDDADGTPQNNYTYPSAWYLSKIESADLTERIDFEYYATGTEQTVYPNNLKSESTYFRSENLNTPPSTQCAPTPTTTGGSVSVAPTIYIKKKFLKKITLSSSTGSTSIDLYSTVNTRLDSDFQEDRLLNQLTVYDNFTGFGDLKKVKQYNFKYGYFFNSSNPLPQDKRRLRLDTLQEISVDPLTPNKPPYKFEYNGTTTPERFTKGIDHWGFYNGSTGQSSLVPTIQINYKGPYGQTAQYNLGKGANREPDLEACSLTILNKITYPTGGYTQFEYGLNEAKDDLGSLRRVGGLRLLTQTDYAFTDRKAVVKSYDYSLDDGSTSGQSVFPQYLKVNAEDLDAVPCLGQVCQCQAYWVTSTVSASSVFGLGSRQGSHIGYSRVTELQKDLATNVTLGKTVYKYAMSMLAYDDDVSNGDLLEKAVYNANGKLLDTLTNTYQYATSDWISGYVVKPKEVQNNKIVCYLFPDSSTVFKHDWDVAPSGNIGQKRMPIQYYLEQNTIMAQSGQLVQQAEKVYDPSSNSYLTHIKQISYDNPLHIYPTRIVENTTGTKQVVTLKKYAGDYPYTGQTGDVASRAIVSLKQNNMLGSEIESVQYRQDADGTNKKYINGSLITYALTPIPTPEKVYRLESVVPLATVTPSAINSGTFSYAANYKPAGRFKYDSNKLIEQAKEGGVITAYIWDAGKYPIAAVMNASRDSVAYTGFESSLSGNNWVVEKTAIDTTLAFTGRMSGLLGSLSKITRTFTTTTAGIMTLSYWGYAPATVKMNTSVILSVAKQGPTINSWTYYEYSIPAGATALELTGNNVRIDELRLYPRAASMQTTSYLPDGNIADQSSSNGEVVRYAYDGYGRLKEVRDIHNNIKKRIDYNFGPGVAPAEAPRVIWYNDEQSASFTKQGCTQGTPSVVLYRVPAGKYSAATLADANALATQDVSANGQNYANANGQCLFYNARISRKFFKNNCRADQGTGGPVTYVVAANKWSATTQAAADDLALNDLNTNGQTYANDNGTCSCGGEGQKLINGNCETGMLVYLTSVQQSNGQYQCTYRYQFSDGSVSQTYTKTSPSPCVNN